MNAKRPALIVGMPYRRLPFRRPFTPMCLPLFPWFDFHQRGFGSPCNDGYRGGNKLNNPACRCNAYRSLDDETRSRTAGISHQRSHQVSLYEEITFERRLERNRLLRERPVARHTSSGRADFTNRCRQWHEQSHQMLNKTRPVAAIAINSVAFNPA